MSIAQPGTDFLRSLELCFVSDVPTQSWLTRPRTKLKNIQTGEEFELRKYEIDDAGRIENVYVLVKEK